MPPLKNLKREKFCKEYINTKANGKQAYITTYGECSNNSAGAKASRLLTIGNVRQRCIELLNETTGLKMKDLIIKLNQLKSARRAVIIDNKLIEEACADYPTQLETVKTILKLYGVLGTSFNLAEYQDNRQLNITINSNDISLLNDIVKRLSDIELRSDKISGLIQTGVISE